ncbi:hypothetical protein ACIP29_11525 [Streptomyces coelicoflavus]|uniref:hypothetical protein n=1 Tax=Streptomyces coelicoflavus TaxID=285562 RepID=UPI003809E917
MAGVDCVGPGEEHGAEAGGGHLAEWADRSPAGLLTITRPVTGMAPSQGWENLQVGVR